MDGYSVITEISSELTNWAKTRGFTLDFKKEKDSLTGASTTIKVIVTSTAQMENEKKVMGSIAKLYGLPEDIVGKTVMLQGKPYTVVGIDPHRPKNCICLRSAQGKEYVCSPGQIKI